MMKVRSAVRIRIHMPSHGMTLPSSEVGLAQAEIDVFEPAARHFCSSDNSSSVEYGAPASDASAPCSADIAQAVRHIFQRLPSTSCHLPSCLRRLGQAFALFRLLGEVSLSDSQHSLTSLFSSGSTRITLPDLTCTTRLAPRPSCGLTDLRAIIQVRRCSGTAWMSRRRPGTGRSCCPTVRN